MEERKQYIECPYCHSRYMYTNDKFNDKGFVQCQNCAKWIQASTGREGPTIISQHEVVPTYVPWSERRKSSPQSAGADLLRIFVHGLVFSLLFSVWSVVWIIAFTVLMVAGIILAGFLGMFGAIVLGFAILIAVMGGLNSLISKYLWGISCSDKPVSLLGHGGLVFFLMLVVGAPTFLISAIGPSIDTYTYFLIQFAIFVVYSVLDGYIARFVALQFEIGHELEEAKLSEGSRIAGCPHCAATYAYTPTSVDSQGNVSCQNCGTKFKLP